MSAAPRDLPIDAGRYALIGEGPDDDPARLVSRFFEAFARGEFLVVMDDESRENEGDLIVAASGCSTEQMAWMIKHTRFVLFILAHSNRRTSTFMACFTRPQSNKYSSLFLL